MLYTIFLKQILLFGFTGLVNNGRSISTKIRPCEVAVFVLQHCRIKNILTNSIFLLFLEKKKESFYPFQDFQGPRPKFKDVPGPGNFFPQFQDFPGFSRTVATLAGSYHVIPDGRLCFSSFNWASQFHIIRILIHKSLT